MDPDQPAGAPDGAAAGEASVNATPSATPNSDELAQPSKKEWVQFQKTSREILEALKGIQAPRPATKEEPPQTVRAKVEQTTDAVAELRAELAFKDALTDLETPVTKDQRKRLEKLYRIDRPTNVEEWLSAEVAALGLKKPATTPATPPAQAEPKPAPAPTNRGAPGSGGAQALPSDILAADVNVVRAMAESDPAALRRWFEQSTGTGLSSHPAHRRRRPGSK